MKLPNKPKVLAATYNPVSNTKMISFLVDFPTVLLAELRTHRILTQGSLYEHSELVDFNLSANSARAIPHNKYLEKVLDNPFIPIWTKQQKGMSGELLVPDEDLEYQYQYAINSVVNNYNTLLEFGVHKQNANRLLAPFAYTTCIISGTEWDNFFSLRLSKDAQPEFREIALMLKELYDNADWKENKYHIPFYQEIRDNYYHEIRSSIRQHMYYFKDDEIDMYMKVSASMCAKLSYNTQDNEDTLEKHLERANMLIEHKHQEPFSHQAVAMDSTEYNSMFKILRAVNINGVKSLKVDLGKCWNLTGFISQRYILENF